MGLVSGCSGQTVKGVIERAMDVGVYRWVGETRPVVRPARPPAARRAHTK